MPWFRNLSKSSGFHQSVFTASVVSIKYIFLVFPNYSCVNFQDVKRLSLLFLIHIVDGLHSNQRSFPPPASYTVIKLSWSICAFTFDRTANHIQRLHYITVYRYKQDILFTAYGCSKTCVSDSNCTLSSVNSLF